MVLFPNAKINIGLNILGVRPDGYHEIESVMCPAGWSDILEVVPSNSYETELCVSGRVVDCPPEKNLVMKALRALQNETGGELAPVRFFLHKVIPDGAGLGGGSSDATFALKGVNELLNLGLSDGQLASVASRVGSDCPFFVYNRPMLATGTGSNLRPIELDLGGYHIAIVKPVVSVPTAVAYSRVTPRAAEVPLAEFDFSLPPREWRGIVKNDFEPSVFASYPVIGEVKERLEELGSEYCSMSGSGAAVYGIFREGGDKLAERVRQAFRGCDVWSGPLG